MLPTAPLQRAEPPPPPPPSTPAPTLCCAFNDSREIQELDVGAFVLGSRRGVRGSRRAGKDPAEPGSAPGPGLSLIPPQPAQCRPCPKSGEASWEGPTAVTAGGNSASKKPPHRVGGRSKATGSWVPRATKLHGEQDLAGQPQGTWEGFILADSWNQPGLQDGPGVSGVLAGPVPRDVHA